MGWTTGKDNSMEERREQDIFYMNMLGGFSMRYGTRKISFARSGNSKFIQLLQLLMIHPRRREFDTCSSTLKPIFLLNKPFMASFFVKFYVFMCTSL